MIDKISEESKRRCIRWCGRNKLTLLEWKGSKGLSKFKCNKCGYIRVASYNNLRRTDGLKGTDDCCFRCRVVKAIKSFYKKDAEIIKINIKKHYALLKCTHCGAEFKLKIWTKGNCFRPKKCKCLTINSKRVNYCLPKGKAASCCFLAIAKELGRRWSVFKHSLKF